MSGVNATLSSDADCQTVCTCSLWLTTMELIMTLIMMTICGVCSGHFLLTQLLLDHLKAAPSSVRVINVMANAYRLGEIMMDDLQFERREYKPGEAYAQSKLAVLLSTRKLSHHLQSTSYIYCLRLSSLVVNPYE